MIDNKFIERLADLKHLSVLKNHNINIISKPNKFHDVVKFFAQIDEKNFVHKITFKATGCSMFMVMCSYFCELVEQKSIEDALEINTAYLQSKYILKDNSVHVLDIIVETFALMIKKYKKWLSTGKTQPYIHEEKKVIVETKKEEKSIETKLQEKLDTKNKEENNNKVVEIKPVENITEEIIVEVVNKKEDKKQKAKEKKLEKKLEKQEKKIEKKERKTKKLEVPTDTKSLEVVAKEEPFEIIVDPEVKTAPNKNILVSKKSSKSVFVNNEKKEETVVEEHYVVAHNDDNKQKFADLSRQIEKIAMESHKKDVKVHDAKEFNNLINKLSATNNRNNSLSSIKDKLNKLNKK